MLSYSILFMNKKLCRTKAFSRVLTNLLKQKPDIIKLNNFKKDLRILIIWDKFFTKKIYISDSKHKKNEHHRIPQIRIIHIQQFHLEKTKFEFMYQICRKTIFSI